MVGNLSDDYGTPYMTKVVENHMVYIENIESIDWVLKCYQVMVEMHKFVVEIHKLVVEIHRLKFHPPTCEFQPLTCEFQLSPGNISIPNRWFPYSQSTLRPF